MKIIATSDLHGNLPSIKEADLLLIGGDIIPLEIQHDIPQSKKWYMRAFYDWVDSIPVNKVLFISGNHDISAAMDDGKFLHNLFSKSEKATYLCDESYNYEGLKIYGTPWCKIFGNWAFMVSNELLKEKFGNIPNDVDFLMTHDAPNQNNCRFLYEGRWGQIDASNPILTEIVKEKKPKYHFCGHLHSGNHILKEVDGTKFANVSYVNEMYVPINEPLEIIV